MEDPIVEVQATEAWKLRLREAEYFLKRYREGATSVPPTRPDYFGMLANADAFLFALVSVPDLRWGDPRGRQPGPDERRIREAGWFALLKELRNITVHQVAALPEHARDVYITPGCQVTYQLRLLPDRLRARLAPRIGRDVTRARQRLLELERNGGDLSLGALMHHALGAMGA